jgi:hypothetical protein
VLFFPYRYFYVALLRQLQPAVQAEKNAIMKRHDWFSKESPVIGLHHRHGNGEIDDFNEPGATRGNANDTKVVKWLARSVAALASALGLPSGYRVFFASDSPRIVTQFKQELGHRRVIDRAAELPGEGTGWVVMGGLNPNFSPNMSTKTHANRTAHDTANALMDMMLLGSTELLLSSKCSSFTTLSKAMMFENGKPIAQALPALGSPANVGWMVSRKINGKLEKGWKRYSDTEPWESKQLGKEEPASDCGYSKTSVWEGGCSAFS